jgi:hypothetical protein
MPPTPFSSPGYQFCTVEYLMLGVIQCDQLDHGGVQLVLVAHRRGAAFKIGHAGAFLGDDQGAFKLAGMWPR